MNKSTKAILALFLVFCVVGVIVIFSLPRKLVGSESYSAMTQASTSIPATVQTHLASTTNQIFAANSSFVYRRMDVASGTVFVLFDNATTTLSSSTDATTLMRLTAGESYTIPNNSITGSLIYDGRIMGVASDSTGAIIRTIEK